MQRKRGQVKLQQWLCRLAFQRGVTGSNGASASAKAKHDNMVYTYNNICYEPRRVMMNICHVYIKKRIISFMHLIKKGTFISHV